MGVLKTESPYDPKTWKQRSPILSNFLGRGNPLTSSSRTPPPPGKVPFSNGGGEEAILVIFDVYKNGYTSNKKVDFCLYSRLLLSLPLIFFLLRGKSTRFTNWQLYLISPCPSTLSFFLPPTLKKLSHLRGWGRELEHMKKKVTGHLATRKFRHQAKSPHHQP